MPTTFNFRKFHDVIINVDKIMRLRIRSVLWVLTIFSVFSFLLRYFLIHYSSEKEPVSDVFTLNRSVRSNESVIIAVVICGQRKDEALVMIKSAIIFQQKSQLTFVILAEFSIHTYLHLDLQRLQSQVAYSFSYELRNLSFPAGREQEWRSLFKPCATQRLFLPIILTNHTNILYVDTDVIFLNELSDIWSYVKKMNATQIAALVPEHEDPNVGWYSRFARHPFYGKLGVNSAVMLMNLEKMREFKWVDYMEPILTKYQFNLTWGDQDIINIIFYYHPDKLYIYPCRYNYRADHCMYKSMCKDAELNGVSVIHGSRGMFHSNKQQAFRAIYEAFEKFELGTDKNQLLESLSRSLQNTTDKYCGTLMNAFTRNLVRLFSKSNLTSPSLQLSLSE